MKRTTITLLLALIMMSVVSAAPSDVPPVSVSLLSYTPVPAQAGDLVTLYVQLENTGDEEASDVEVRIEPTSVLSTQGRDELSVGTIAARSTYVARFTVKISPTASAGDSVFTVLTSQATKGEQRTTLSLAIEADDAGLSISDVSVTPSRIEPGKEAIVNIRVESLTEAVLRDVKVNLDLEDLPFVPTTQSTTRSIGELNGASSAIAKFTLATEPAATANVYRVPVTITFLDEQGTSQTVTDVIGLTVDTPGQTRAFADDVNRNEDIVEVSIRIVNKGLSEVKFVEATFADGDDFHVLEQDKNVYVGNIESDDWETIRIEITTDAEKLELPLVYTFKDAFNEEHQVNQQFTIDVPPKPEKNPLSSVLIIVVVLVLLVIFWQVKRRRKKKR